MTTNSPLSKLVFQEFSQLKATNRFGMDLSCVSIEDFEEIGIDVYSLNADDYRTLLPIALELIEQGGERCFQADYLHIFVRLPQLNLQLSEFGDHSSLSEIKALSIFRKGWVAPLLGEFSNKEMQVAIKQMENLIDKLEGDISEQYGSHLRRLVELFTMGIAA